jgi:hypothetical protein
MDELAARARPCAEWTIAIAAPGSDLQNTALAFTLRASDSTTVGLSHMMEKQALIGRPADAVFGSRQTTIASFTDAFGSYIVVRPSGNPCISPCIR